MCVWEEKEELERSGKIWEKRSKQGTENKYLKFCIIPY